MGVLVTGGAGYIGSFVVKRLIDLNYEVVVIDNLSNGHKSAVSEKASFYICNIGNSKILNKIFEKHRFDAVMHFAGFIEMAESVANPLKYFKNNVANGITLLSVIKKHKVKNIIFSSSAGIYGASAKIPITEDSEKKPANPYGISKHIFEQVLKNSMLNFISLRYFNAAGAGFGLGEDHNPESHVIPSLLKSILQKKKFKIFGSDYPTNDGTCIRDYIHILDLVDAHVLALDALLKNKKPAVNQAFNVGTGKGNSILEIIRAIEENIGKKVDYEFAARRKGDVPMLVASYEKINNILGWKPKHDINDIIKSAWEFHSKFPNGFEDWVIQVEKVKNNYGVALFVNNSIPYIG